jgi:hypothetical protein
MSIKIGMLWLANDPKRTLADKVMDAVAYYEKKYGISPDLCHVHSSMVDKSEPRIAIIADDSIQVSHLWIGVSNEN